MFLTECLSGKLLLLNETNSQLQYIFFDSAVMKTSFCATIARQTGEEPIGTASHYQTYVLIECPCPWSAKVFDSRQIPLALKQFITQTQSQRSVRFFCVNQGRAAQSKSDSKTRVLIYDSLHLLEPERAFTGREEGSGSWFGSYRGFEFVVDGLEQVADCVRAYWQGINLGKPITRLKDVLICTHGMRDKCCARFGQPFFKAAEKMVKEKSLSDVRIWRVSHIGGHRFAPTAIVLPEGRYYARLTVSALQSFLTRCGSTDQLLVDLQQTYRGWGLLPTALQVLERRFFRQFGWDWLSYRLSYCVLEENDKTTRAVLWMRSPAGVLTTYRAEVTRSRHPNHEIKTACNADSPYIPVQYAITELTKLNQHQPVQAIIAASR